MIKPKGSFPVFIIKDLSAARAYYTDYFSFSVVFDTDWYVHLVTEAGIEVGFMVSEYTAQPKEFQSECSGEGIVFSLEVDDADAAYEYAKDKKLNMIFDIKNEDWGQRHFVLRDPNGIMLDILQNTEVSAEYKDHYIEPS